MARVKLRPGVFENVAVIARGLDSQRAQARAIGVHESIHSRALAGQISLSGEYVVGVLKTLGDKRIRNLIDELFEVDDEMQAAS